METLFNLLNSIRPMSAEVQQYLLSVLKVKELKRKELVLRAGQISKEVYFIQSGLLRCYRLKNGKEISRWFMREGDVVFSIASFFDQVPSVEEIEVLEECSLYYITRGELDYLERNYLDFTFISLTLHREYYKLWDRLLYVSHALTAEERFLWLLDEHHELVNRVPAKYIASWLGVTEVHYSNIKSKVFLNKKN